MTEQEIDALAGRALDRAVALELGILDARSHNRIVKRRALPDGSWRTTEWRDLPHYATDIAAAWTLDGDGWEWSSDDVVLRNYPQMFGTNNRIMEVSVYIKKNCFNGFCQWETLQDKAAAYATARCRVWLKARLALKEAE